MEKAYDFKALVEQFKSKGLDLAEEGAELAYDAFVEWFTESAELSVTPYDNLILIVLPELTKQVKVQIDKIDGKEG